MQPKHGREASQNPPAIRSLVLFLEAGAVHVVFVGSFAELVLEGFGLLVRPFDAFLQFRSSFFHSLLKLRKQLLMPLLAAFLLVLGHQEAVRGLFTLLGTPVSKYGSFQCRSFCFVFEGLLFETAQQGLPVSLVHCLQGLFVVGCHWSDLEHAGRTRPDPDIGFHQKIDTGSRVGRVVEDFSRTLHYLHPDWTSWACFHPVVTPLAVTRRHRFGTVLPHLPR